jgi:hypothetical protein
MAEIPTNATGNCTDGHLPEDDFNKGRSQSKYQQDIFFSIQLIRMPG